MQLLAVTHLVHLSAPVHLVIRTNFQWFHTSLGEDVKLVDQNFVTTVERAPIAMLNQSVSE